MRTAVFHDYFSAIGGGEKTVVAMAKALNADIITTDTTCFPKMEWDGPVRNIGSIIELPLIKQTSASIRFILSNLSKQYDVVLFSGNWAHLAAEHYHPNIWYCHSPPRILYDQYSRYYQTLTPGLRIPFASWAYLHRSRDKRAVKHIDRILTNSQNVQNRISHYYNREAEVISPPVNCKRYSCEEFGSFWLSVNRLYPEKRIELQLDAFRSLPNQHLVIVGSYAKNDYTALYARNVIKKKPENVSFLGEVSEEELRDLYARCQGVICTTRDEDFGIVPLEAMASGKPVVAVHEGGFRETVKDGITGILTGPSGNELAHAISQVTQNPNGYKEACLLRAREFDISIFERKIREAVMGL